MPRPHVMRPLGLASLAAFPAALLAAYARPAAAQVLAGRVVETPSGRAIGGVAVRLYRVAAAAPGTPASAASADPAVVNALPVRPAVIATNVTAADGVFTLLAPEPGAYRVRVGAGALAPAVTLAADSSVERVYGVPLDYRAPLYRAQVDQAARPVPGTVMLRYPPPLQMADVTGCAAVERQRVPPSVTGVPV